MNNTDCCELFCKGKQFTLPKQGELSQNDLLLATQGSRSWYFSLIGNTPSHPKLALVGLCPAHSQLHTLVKEYNGGLSFLDAAGAASFSGTIRSNLIKLLKKIDLDKEYDLVLDDSFDPNTSPLILTTSLVKCASLKEGKDRSAAYNPLSFETSRLCLRHRFVSDMLSYPSLEKIIVFGKIAESALSTPLLENNQSIKDFLESKGLQCIFLPHPSGANNGTIKKFLEG
jgi:hypothetical protein